MSMLSKRLLAAGFVAAGCWGLSLDVSAMMPPYVYEEARNEAADVVVIAVQNVIAPETYGVCEVQGIVHAVERGTRYAEGEPITLKVDCLRSGAAADVPVGGTIWQDVEALTQSRFGRAYLNEDGTIVLSQYEQLSESEI
jgi:hypothetical protein